MAVDLPALESDGRRVSPNVILPLVSSVVSFIFSAAVFAQWSRRRQAFQLVWAVGLLWYGISAGTEFLGSALGWSEPLYRTWYLFGAFFVAAYLGMGTAYLLGRTRFGYFIAVSLLLSALFTFAAGAKYDAPGPAGVAAAVAAATAVVLIVLTAVRRDLATHALMAVLAAASVIVAILVVTATLSAPYAVAPDTGVPIGDAMPNALRPLPIPFNVGGAFTLVAGALFSAYVFMPKNRILGRRALPPVVAQLYGALAVVVNFIASLPRAVVALFRGELHSRVPATLLIALGGFIPGVTSGLNRFGVTWSFFLGELLGVLLIFAGFVVSTEVFGSRVRIGPLVMRREEKAPAT
jgi:hypothetical protein